MQLSDEAKKAIEIWAKGFNALIEDLIAQRNKERSRSLDILGARLSKKDALMKVKEKELGLGPWWWDPNALYHLFGRNMKEGGEKKKRSPKESK